MCAESNRRWISDTIVSKSSASSFVIDQYMRGSWAVGLRNMPKAPRTRFANPLCSLRWLPVVRAFIASRGGRSEEHTSELQSLMCISYAVFCLKKNKLANQLSTLILIVHSYSCNIVDILSYVINL